MTAYYNEIDPFAADWLRHLIAWGQIAPGDVDTRSIEDVTPNDLRGYRQHHFFAGVGGWSLAARIAGWPDDLPLATGSCPCQPFSVAGKGAGLADERHLWPAQHYLIQQCRFPIWCGEQVASSDGLAWLDVVHADMEATGYSGGALDLCSAGFGAPNIRQRLYLAYGLGGAAGTGLERCAPSGPARSQRQETPVERGGALGGVAGAADHGCEGRQPEPARRQDAVERPPRGQTGGMADVSSQGWGSNGPHNISPYGSETVRPGTEEPGRCGPIDPGTGGSGTLRDPGPVNGWWGDADWLLCRNLDGGAEWRPAEPGAFPLAHGVPNRMGLLRGYGNAINPQVAAHFLKAVKDQIGA